MYLTSLLFLSALSSLNLISHALPIKPQALPKQPAVRRRVAYSVVAVDGGSASTPSSAPVPGVLTPTQTSHSIETVTAPASSTPRSIETVSVTKVVSELEPAKTVFITLAQNIIQSTPPATIPSYIVVESAQKPTSSLTVPLSSQTYTNFQSGNCVTSFSTLNINTPSGYVWGTIPSVSIPLASSYRASEATHSAEAKHPEGKGSEIVASTLYPSPPPPPATTMFRTLSTFSTKTYDDGKWHTSYPVWNATSTVRSSASTTAVATGRAQNVWRKG